MTTHKYTDDPKHCHQCAIQAFVNAEKRARAAETSIRKAFIAGWNDGYASYDDAYGQATTVQDAWKDYKAGKK